MGGWRPGDGPALRVGVAEESLWAVAVGVVVADAAVGVDAAGAANLAGVLALGVDANLRFENMSQHIPINIIKNVLQLLISKISRI